MKYAFLFIVIILATALTTKSALLKYYEDYGNMEKHLQSNFNYDASTANAIKHAKASADMYRLLHVVLTADMAEEAVIRLGFLNEYIERLKDKEDRDSAREIMKDLHNNYAGILAARAADRTDAFKIILAFADNRTLIVKNIYNPFFEGKEPRKHVVAYSREWFAEHRNEIDQRIEWKLARAKDLLPLENVQISSASRKPQLVE